MTTERQTRKDRLNALDSYADNLLVENRERELTAREWAAVEERLSRQQVEQAEEQDGEA